MSEALTGSPAIAPELSYTEALLAWETALSARPTDQQLIALIPKLLLICDHPWSWERQLQPLFLDPPPPAEYQTGLSLVAILATALGETPPLAILPQSAARLQAIGLALPTPLTTVQTLLEQRVGLRAAIAALNPPLGEAPSASPLTELALACYLWLSTPACFSLSLQRAHHLSAPPIVPILVGALSGFSNTERGIPLLDQLRLETQDPTPTSQNTAQRLRAAADQLCMQWAGMGGDSPDPHELQRVDIASA